jgi:hypothetical protein
MAQYSLPKDHRRPPSAASEWFPARPVSGNP